MFRYHGSCLDIIDHVYIPWIMFRYHGSYRTCTASAKPIVVVSGHTCQWWIPNKQGNFESFIFLCFCHKIKVIVSLIFKAQTI